MNYIIGSNNFGWSQYYHVDGKRWEEHLEEVLSIAAQAGIATWEQQIQNPEQAKHLRTLLAKYGLQSVSAYSGGRLYDSDWKVAAERMLESAKLARELGVTHLVHNPDTPWYQESRHKTETELKVQAEALCFLAQELSALGMTLDYHTHAPEFLAGAREFHHMLNATAEVGMRWNLDVHWVYSGTEYSQIGLEDCLKLYGHRIGSLHIRQSRNHIWSDHLCDGDVDYQPVFECLRKHDFNGPLIIENAYQPETKREYSLLESHRKSVEWLTDQISLSQ